MAPQSSSHIADDDRRAELLDRRTRRRGGRRLTDRRFDIVHGLPCQACDTGILTLADTEVAGTTLNLTYRCPTCGETRLVSLGDVGDDKAWDHAYGPPTITVAPSDKGQQPG